ncbi:MAG TPA: hypothetical protein VGE41_02400 [Verrucomicrobiae bacterium]
MASSSTNLKAISALIFFTYASFLCAPRLQADPFNVPAPPLLSIIRSNSGVVRLNYEVQTQFWYVVRASSNGLNWTSLFTNISPVASSNYVDTGAVTNSRRFYSAIALKTPRIFEGVVNGAGELGGFLLYIRTNNVATLLGYDSNRTIGLKQDGITIGSDGLWCGPLIGSLSICTNVSSNKFGGFFSTSTGTPWNCACNVEPSLGSFQRQAGWFSGNWGAGGCSGTIQAILCPNGTIYFFLADADGVHTDGYFGTVLGNAFGPIAFPSGMHITGTVNLNPTSPTISGTITHACPSRDQSGTLGLTRSEKFF